MKIIRQGNINKTLQFHCDKCNCLWEADKGEYEPTPQLAQIHDGLNAYWMRCPCCGDYTDCLKDMPSGNVAQKY